jgi:hypothetical protein
MRSRLGAVLAVLVLTTGCGDKNSLSGSIQRIFSLEFDRVAILWQEPSLSIQYLDDVPEGTYKVVNLILDTENLTISDNSDVLDETFLDRVTLKRVTQTEAEFPVISGGLLHFDKYSTDHGKTVSGNFHIQFDNGLNLAGTFEAKVKHVSPDEVL